MQIRFGSTPIYVVSDAKTAKEILKIHDVDFASKYTLGFGLSKFDIYDGYTFFNAPYGTYWRFMKKLCMTKLFGGPQLDRFFQIREQETLKLLKSLVDKSREGKPCDIGEELSVFASAISCRMVIGNICVENPNLPIEIRKLVGDIMENAAKFSFNEVFGPLPTRKYDELLEQLMKKYDDNFDINSCDEEQKDLMFILMETYKDTNAELKLTRTHIKKFFLGDHDFRFLPFGSGRRACIAASHGLIVTHATIGALVQCFDWEVKDGAKIENELETEHIGAGTDTSSIKIEWGLAKLINHPIMMEKARQEIDSVVGRSRPVPESDIANLPYLQAISFRPLENNDEHHIQGLIVSCMKVKYCSSGGTRLT
ncbi:cytochrome P450 family protein [Salix suchowensis]|nr:cytochrome P450 family protein [Salix suchowensis]